ncbi:hypothetical protein BK674_18365 [Pseudomonas moraviensis]|uniref:Apea-like HEPN domain-containing protein n=1 Tax=Pseudomonas moraviensis TaxID=321662 RepID=A0A423NMB1_9PSED|nr:hypothetical protein [Pseudomonas moraviensis]RON99405.1 hypothetical protein BK674_18365 [Pseudomonas moraviensis]
MKFKGAKKWHLQEDLANLFFMAQRLDELFFDYTLDTYKPPALNSIYLCREAISLIQDVENELIDSANLHHVLEELEWSLTSDTVAKRLLNAPVKKFIIQDESIKLAETKVRLEVLERTLNPLRYIEQCQIVLLGEMENGSKKVINEVVRSYASTLINCGVSKQHLQDKVNSFFFYGHELKNIDEAVDFFELVFPVSHDFEIYFIVSDLIKNVKDSIKAFHLSIVDELPDTIKRIADQASFIPLENEVWVSIEDIETFDRHNARQEAESTLNIVRDLFLLYSHKNRISWREQAIIVQCCDEQPVLTRKPKSTMEKCFDLRPGEAATRLNYLIKNISLSGNSFRKFNRAVDLHGISSTNDLPENQLLNIWIALETLVPSHTNGGGKIVKVCNAIIPVMMKNYLRRLVEDLAADLILWNRSKIGKLVKTIDNAKHKNLYQKILELISIQENAELRSKLYVELGNFHLLRFRVFELSELFRKPDLLLKKIATHEKKVAWQLRRIYRTRNLIVHTGRSIPYINSLIENAHDYLDQTMNMIVQYSCGELSAKSLEQAFDMAKLDWEVYFERLKTIEKVNPECLSELIEFRRN